eukprot:756975-Pleurochrysis_carterae.AAC.1
MFRIEITRTIPMPKYACWAKVELKAVQAASAKAKVEARARAEAWDNAEAIALTKATDTVGSSA